MFRGYAAHIAGLVKKGRGGWAVSFCLSSIVLNEHPGADEEENSAQGTSESDESDEPNSQVATLTNVSEWTWRVREHYD